MIWQPSTAPRMPSQEVPNLEQVCNELSLSEEQRVRVNSRVPETGFYTVCPALRTTLGAESKNAVSLREPIFIAQICHKIGEQSAEQSTLLFVLCIEKIIYYQIGRAHV